MTSSGSVPSGQPARGGNGTGWGPQRLAEYATRRPWRVLTAWGVIALVSLGLLGTLLASGVTSDQTLTNHPESYVARDLIDQRLADRNEVDEVIVVRSEDSVVSDPAFTRRIRALVAEARGSGSVHQIRTYLEPGGRTLVSADRHAALLPVVLRHDKTKRIDDLVPIVERANSNGGFAVHIVGENTLGRDFTKVSEDDLSKGELQFGLPAALLILLLVFGTLTGALIPMCMAIISIIVALGLAAAVGQAFKLNLFITNMVVAMGLALGIDYSLFIVSRLREERRRGSSTREAIMTVSNTATRAVVFSGTAFTLAMIGMLLVPNSTLRSLGFGAVLVGMVSIAVALTFHPALLMVLGDRVDRLRLPWLGRRVAASAGEEGRVWRRMVLAVMRRPGLYLIVTTALLIAAASPILGMKLGSSGGSSLPDGTVGKQGLLALQRDFPTGATDPVKIVVDGSPTAPQTQQGVARLRAELARDRDFAAGALTTQSGPRILVASLPLTVEPGSERASAAIDRLRDDHVPRAFGSGANRVFVGGGPAEARDSFAIDSSWLPIVIALVLALSFVLLTLAFRSIVIAGTAIAVNLLSVGAAYGILVLVFQQGVGNDLLGFDKVDRIESWVPIFLFSVLFGLSMDYQVFLLSRIHERWRATGDTREAIVHGVASTARLITGAAAIIVVVFLGFATGKLVSFQQMGFGIAVALLLDATLVRLILIPAAMQLLGERNWALPRWLAWLPHLQIEGPSPASPRSRTRQPAPARPAVLTPAIHHEGQEMTAHPQEIKATRFPGWRWVAVAVAIPIAGWIGHAIGGPTDAIEAAIIGGIVTGGLLGLGEWWSARGALGDAQRWIGSSAVGYGLGLAAGAALVGYETDLGSLALMGAVSGAALGAAQGLALAAQGRVRLGLAWAAAMPLLLAAGWSVTTLGGIDVDRQFTVFGAFGAILFMVLSGLLLARFTNPPTEVA